MKKWAMLKKVLLNNPSNWKYWFFLALVIKLVYFVIQIHHITDIPGFWGTSDTDTYCYTVPFENLVNKGVYFPDWRMPGYGVLYLPLYFLFSKATACNLVIIIQLILSALSVYVLALISKLLFKNNLMFYLTFYIYLISRFSSTYDSFLLTDSLTASLLIFSVFYFVSYFTSYNKIKLLISGLFIAWVIFLRQVFLLQLGFFAVILIAESARRHKNIVAALVWLILPFVVCDGMWTIRNYRVYKKVIPIVKSMYYGSGAETVSVTPVYLAQLEFCASWGENRIDWDVNSNIYWFLNGFNLRNSVKVTEPHFPSYIYTSKFNEDSLIMVRKLIADIDTAHLSKATKDEYSKAVVAKLQAYTQSIKHEKPLLYYVKAPLIHLRRFLIDYGTNFNLYQVNKSKATGREYLLKVFYNTILYFMVLAFGFLGIILLFKSFFKLSVLSLIPGIPIYITIVHPLIFQFDLYRYFVPAYPFMVICAAYAFIWLYGKVTKSPSVAIKLQA